MNAMDALKAAAKKSGVPITHIGPKIGNASTFVNVTVNRGSTPRADTLAKMLEVCGYSLCAVPADLVTDDMLVITGEDGNGEG